MKQLGDDIWVANNPVPPHEDSTAEEMLTYGLVIFNSGHTLIYGGERIPLPIGSIYVIDGRRTHSTEGQGLLILLIWDMPDYTLEDFRRDIRADIRFGHIFDLYSTMDDPTYDLKKQRKKL